jgi:ABC-type multidrug transport system fused ATPase/permease subunit
MRYLKHNAIIAHRLSTVKNADIIYVLDDGVIVESGSFEELVEANGGFAKMVRLQSF